jgi:hypothetical protein
LFRNSDEELDIENIALEAAAKLSPVEEVPVKSILEFVVVANDVSSSSVATDTEAMNIAIKLEDSANPV